MLPHIKVRKKVVKINLTSPKGVLYYLKEMKNILELMTDLAYSSILLNDKSLAEDVFELEEKMDDLLRDLSKEIMLSRLPPNEVESMLPVFKIASASEEVSDALRNIAEVGYRQLNRHPVLLEALEETDRRTYRVIIDRFTSFLNKSVSTDDLVSKTGFRILSFKKKDGDWVYYPEKTPPTKSGDVLILKGPTKNHSKLEKLFGFQNGEREN
jgi:uncharacterized protein with PhoU and TrkA domain